MALSVALSACGCDVVPPPSYASTPPSDLSPIVAAMPVQDERSIASLGAYVRAHTPNPIERIKALHDWVANHIAYDTAAIGEPSAEDLDPEQVFARRKGVCGGYARLLTQLGLAAGVDIRYVSGNAPGGPHAWNEANVAGSLEPIDVTWDAGYVDDAGRFHRQYSTRYFLAHQDVFARDHERIDPPCEQCTALRYESYDVPGDREATFRKACAAGVTGACYELDAEGVAVTSALLR